MVEMQGIIQNGFVSAAYGTGKAAFAKCDLQSFYFHFV